MIPLLAKGDSFEKPELKKVKCNIVEMARKQNVEFFDVVSTIDDIKSENDRNLIKSECLIDHALAPCPPFAIINPSQIKSLKNGASEYKRLGRNYEWGFVDSLDPNNSDFTRLHKLVLKYIRKELIKTMDLKYDEWVKETSKAKC